MGSISNFLEDELLDHVMGVGAYTVPTNICIGLSTADPLDDASGLAEPSGNGYARVTLNTWNTAASRAITNNGVITFPTATGAWGTITHWAIFDAATSGNMLAHGSLSASKAVVSGNTPSIASAAISVSFSTGGITTFLANELLDHVFKVGSYTPPTIYVALCTVAPDDASTGSNITEPSGNNYARKAHSAWDAASAGHTENTGAISFNNPSGSWGTITHCCICDAATVGNALWYGTATPNQAPTSGDTVSYPDGALDITLT